MGDGETGTRLAIVEREKTATLARRERPELVLSPEQRQMIRNSYANGASEEEFAVLVEVCKAKRLNPLLGQVHLVKRWNQDRGCDVWATQTSIDGFRSIAEDTGLYDGQDEPEFEYADPEKKRLLLARVRVYRKDVARPFVGVAHYAEYVQRKRDGNPNKMWAEKPHIMISKCAESLALRKAFPQELGDIHTPEEIGDHREDAQDRLTGQIGQGVGTVDHAPRAAKTEAPREDWLAKIAAATTRADLDAMGRLLNADKSIGGPERKALAEVYRARYAEMREQAEKGRACDECKLLGSHSGACSKFEPPLEREPGAEG